jgi:type II secretory pathway component PulF
MSDWLKEWWPMLWAFVISGVQLVQILLAKTYARKEEVQEVSNKVDLLEAKVESMPTQELVTRLTLELSEARGEMRELRAKIQPVEHLAQLLLEQRLKDDK